MSENPLMTALSQVEKTEANLAKAEKVWSELQTLLPEGLFFRSVPEYEDRVRTLAPLLASLPKIDGWSPQFSPPDASVVSSSRADYLELGEPIAAAQFESEIWSGGGQLDDYRFRLSRLRRQLVRDNLTTTMREIEEHIAALQGEAKGVPDYGRIESGRWKALASLSEQIDIMLGEPIFPTAKWGNFRRHVHFGCQNDLVDIVERDWPGVKKALETVMYAADEPIPVEVVDLSALVAAKPRGEIVTALRWEAIDADGFERLVFNIVDSTPEYENPEWLMHTNAPDKGRDLSAFKVNVDSLGGVERKRVIFQCKHVVRGVSQPDAAGAYHQMGMWVDPKVDLLIIATIGRFSSDAVQWIEKHNASGLLPKIDMWPNSKLESILSSRPHIVAEFGLRP